MVRSTEQAIRWTQDRGLIPDEAGHKVGAAGWCKRETRSAFAVESDGSDDATEAFHRTQHRHSAATVPPRGAVCWWTGGRKGHGHVAISLGNGNIRSTDLPTSGRWGTVRLNEPVKSWGLHYEGWSEDIDGVRVFTPAPRPHKPPKASKPSRLANLRTQLLQVAKTAPTAKRRAAAAAAAACLKGFS